MSKVKSQMSALYREGVNSLKQIIEKANKINWLKMAQIITMVVIIAAPLMVFAAPLSSTFQCDPTSGMNCNAPTNVNGLIRLVINWLLGIAFGIAVLFLIIGGFWYITSAGNEETAEKGKNTAINALIGIVIIILSYVIVNVVSNLVGNAGGAGQ